MANKPGCPDPCLGHTCPETKVVQLNQCTTQINRYECQVCFLLDPSEDCGDNDPAWLVFPCFYWHCNKVLVESETVVTPGCKVCDPMPYPEEHVPHEGSPLRGRVPSEEQEWFVRNQFKKNHPRL